MINNSKTRKKKGLLRSLYEREAAYIESPLPLRETEETGFNTEEDGLFFIGDDGAEAGRKDQRHITGSDD